jgi:hypothetical protein
MLLWRASAKLLKSALTETSGETAPAQRMAASRAAPKTSQAWGRSVTSRRGCQSTKKRQCQRVRSFRSTKPIFSRRPSGSARPSSARPSDAGRCLAHDEQRAQAIADLVDLLVIQQGLDRGGHHPVAAEHVAIVQQLAAVVVTGEEADQAVGRAGYGVGVRLVRQVRNDVAVRAGELAPPPAQLDLKLAPMGLE